ncbi:hypothetical protein Acy02nite_16950 [Actinoplanes cyaneus]|uniref:DUF2637 domain-containing protein n=1 Tax=Actinoplanes cyaneus TaxID=52696 RepID=A0A919M5X7_9ACTN|nr:hypothetical protein [Actinoplanes cyaneus]MCW2142029.1 hypothetical protein [Actinoplanes cyaneus]GID63814.1 hypothetical protein Acy02nite_16950 [Actinoplanes cyaneus]
MSKTDTPVTGLPRRPAPAWVAPVLALLGVATIPWTVYLSLTLPQRMEIGNYRTAWVGFDVLLVLGLLATAYTAWRGRQRVGLFAASTATLLVVDAWFDVTLSNRAGLTTAVVSAAVIEIPLALLCGWIALHADRLAEHRLRRLARQATRLRAVNGSRTPGHPARRRAEARLEQLLREETRLRHGRAGITDPPGP